MELDERKTEKGYREPSYEVIAAQAAEAEVYLRGVPKREEWLYQKKQLLAAQHCIARALSELTLLEEDEWERLKETVERIDNLRPYYGSD